MGHPSMVEGIEPKKRVLFILLLPPASEFAQKRDLGHPLNESRR